jgi:hypothetical protein
MMPLLVAQGKDASQGMAGALEDPAALLRIYMRHGRLSEAAKLAIRCLHSWQMQVPSALLQNAAHGGPVNVATLTFLRHKFQPSQPAVL